MKEFSEQFEVQSMASAAVLTQARTVEPTHACYVGLDVHKDTIAVALAWPGRAAPEYLGEISNTPKAVAKLATRLSQQTHGEVMLWCYEAGPCGYVLHRQLLDLGQDCEVVAPPRPERIKTNRCDATRRDEAGTQAARGRVDAWVGAGHRAGGDARYVALPR